MARMYVQLRVIDPDRRADEQSMLSWNVTAHGYSLGELVDNGLTKLAHKVNRTLRQMETGNVQPGIKQMPAGPQIPDQPGVLRRAAPPAPRVAPKGQHSR